jgi:hypothetical protein
MSLSIGVSDHVAQGGEVTNSPYAPGADCFPKAAIFLLRR